MADMKPKLKVDVNSNPTKKGVKVQFILPQTLVGDEKASMTQKLQSKLNSGLAKFSLTANADTDVPFENVIGFLISIQDIRLMIKNALMPSTETPATPAPEAPAAPEEEVTAE
jgi:hypothetical protein